MSFRKKFSIFHWANYKLVTLAFNVFENMTLEFFSVLIHYLHTSIVALKSHRTLLANFADHTLVDYSPI